MKRGKPLRRRRKETCKHRAWDAFSKYIRLRDADENGMVKCISCDDVKHWKEMQAGHFVAASVSLALRFDERNVNTQCPKCNCWDDRSIHRYTIAMRKKYGPDIVEELDEIRRNGQGFKIYETGYRELLEKYQQKAEAPE